jgi:hypothetical protein
VANRFYRAKGHTTGLRLVLTRKPDPKAKPPVM